MKTIDIIGLGESVSSYDNADNYRIGVNDAFRHVTCDLIVCINELGSFSGERRNIILSSYPKDGFVTIKNENGLYGTGFNVQKPNMEWLLNTKGNIKPNAGIKSDTLYHARTSPFVAVMLAYNMGAQKIRCFGVDLNTHRIFRKGTDKFKSELKCWQWLIDQLKKKNVIIEFTKESVFNSL